jgi:hypothetical protein
MSRIRLGRGRAATARPTSSGLITSLALVFLSLAIAVPASSQVPHPRDVFGFTPGDDYQLADYGQMLEYYDLLDAASDRVQKIEFGHSVLGKPMVLLFISSEENLAQLDRWRETAATLARARISEDEARELAAGGKAVVWIDGGMHATERAHAQMTSLLAYRVATEESPEMQRIRDDVILLLNPVINPDGLDISTDWYRQNRGTAFETTGPPILYHHYVGHDNNRDWFMILQPETRAVSRMLYHEWYPQIVYNHHQTGPPWARMFIPPFADPVNPNIQPGVITGVNLVGAAMHQRFSEEEKPGVISRVLFSMWWNGGGRTAPYYHNMIGILSETSHSTPTPRYYDPAELPDPLNPYGGRREASVPTSRPTIWYPDPWEGGWSHFSDAVDYMITGSMAVLDIASRRREQWLYNIYDMGRDAIEAGEAGGPYAYVVPPDQWDPAETVEMINALRRGGVEVHRARSSFQAGGNDYAAGSYVLFAGQAFRPYLMDLMEPQKYPDRRRYAGGPPDPPYDLAGWTLPIQMGVAVGRRRSRALDGGCVHRRRPELRSRHGGDRIGWRHGLGREPRLRLRPRLHSPGESPGRGPGGAAHASHRHVQVVDAQHGRGLDPVGARAVRLPRRHASRRGPADNGPFDLRRGHPAVPGRAGHPQRPRVRNDARGLHGRRGPGGRRGAAELRGGRRHAGGPGSCG